MSSTPPRPSRSDRINAEAVRLTEGMREIRRDLRAALLPATCARPGLPDPGGSLGVAGDVGEPGIS